ncbi:hypothetical protein ACOXXX_18285 [Thalassococcus sp. BH17M4-6]|uniref:hypothetical protein n=1 Tax=Thalassococcus sp. BH17M4-6 TaxID=3413148 RepID=UPI003BEE3772
MPHLRATALLWLTRTAMLALSAQVAGAQVLSNADATIRNSLCLGADCIDDPVFDEPDETDSNIATLELSALRTQIHLNDTSAPSFPTSDWFIRTNDFYDPLAQGGENFFSIQQDRGFNATSRPFTIEASAPTHAIYVDSSGDIGLGTREPLAPLHVLIAPNGASADAGVLVERIPFDLGSQAYDIYIDTAGQLGLVNRTAGLTPFAIDVGAPDDGLTLEADALRLNAGQADFGLHYSSAQSLDALFVAGDSGSMGLGTAAPIAPLHISRNDGTAAVRVENARSSPPAPREMFAMVNNAGSYFTLENTRAETSWFFVHEDAAPNRFIITDAVPDGPEMTLTAEGDLTIPGQLFTAGSCAAGCDRVFDADYPLPTIAEQAAMMRDLKHLPAVGPTPEDGPFNITAMTGGMLNELEKAHLYIAELDGALTAERARNAAQEAQNAALAARVSRLEALVANLAAR